MILLSLLVISWSDLPSFLVTVSFWWLNRVRVSRSRYSVFDDQFYSLLDRVWWPEGMDPVISLPPHFIDRCLPCKESKMKNPAWERAPTKLSYWRSTQRVSYSVNPKRVSTESPRDNVIMWIWSSSSLGDLSAGIIQPPLDQREWRAAERGIPVIWGPLAPM